MRHVPLVAAIAVPIIAGEQDLEGSAGMRSQIAADIVVDQVKIGIAKQQRRADRAGRHHDQLPRPDRRQFALPAVCHPHGSLILDQHLDDGRIVNQGRPVVDRLGNLGDRRAHQRVVLARHACVQTMAAEDAAMPVGGSLVRRNAERVGRLLVEHARFAPVFPPVAVDVQDLLRLLKVTLEQRLGPSLDLRLVGESVPVHQSRTHPRAHIDVRAASHYARLALHARVDLVRLDHVHRVREEGRAPIGEGVVRLILAEIDLRRVLAALRRAEPEVRRSADPRPGVQNQHRPVRSHLSGQKSFARSGPADDDVVDFLGHLSPNHFTSIARRPEPGMTVPSSL